MIGDLRLASSAELKGFSSPLVLNRWATARKSGGPQTFAYFSSEFASRMRLRNTGAYEQLHGPAPINWRRNDLIFLCKSPTPIPPADWSSSALGRQ